MKDTAFFPAKFQPLHLGHIISICRIKEMDYKYIIIGLTHDVPHIRTPEENMEILKRIFNYDYTSKRMSFEIIDKTLLDHECLHDFPGDIDVLSGNPEVLKWAEKYGYNPVFFPRTEGVGFSGTEIRRLYNL